MSETRTNLQKFDDDQIGDWRNILTAEEKVVAETKIRRLDEHEALVYCKARGFSFQHTKYFTVLKSLKGKTKRRIFAILKWKLEEQHLERIDELETIKHTIWKDYNSETDYKKRADIALNIAKLQPLMSIYFKDLAIVSEKQLQLSLQVISRQKQEKKIRDIKTLKNVNIVTKTDEENK